MCPTMEGASWTTDAARSRHCQRSWTQSGDAQKCCSTPGFVTDDVLEALALGADAVLIGRLSCWGLAAGGADGVRAVLEILRAELVGAMALSGVTQLNELHPGMVRATIPA